MTPVVVVKLGSSVLASEADLPAAVAEIVRLRSRGNAVVAVVSAFAGRTDGLLGRARRVSREPEPRALAALVATGESRAAAMLALALDAAGVPARLLDPESAGLYGEGGRTDARPSSVNSRSIRRALAAGWVAVVPGFFGRHRDGGVALFGRGGSDLTALFLAWRLRAECRLVKDCDGWFESDPAQGGTPARWERLSFADAVELSEPIVQDKALCFAERHGVAFRIAALGSDGGTAVGPGRSRLAREP